MDLVRWTLPSRIVGAGRDRGVVSSRLPRFGSLRRLWRFGWLGLSMLCLTGPPVVGASRSSSARGNPVPVPVTSSVATPVPVTSAPAAPVSAICPVPHSTCPQTQFGWMLFQDSTHGVPDFWLEGSLEVYEISVCPHGVHLVFEVEERGNRHVAALTFPTPSPELVEERLGLDPSGRNGARRLAQYEARYVELRANIERVLDTSLGSGKQFDFRKRAAESRPIVEHGKGTLVLRWKERSAELRGYLDVYFTLPT